MIDIDRLSKRFSGRTVVNDLSFRIDRERSSVSSAQTGGQVDHPEDAFRLPRAERRQRTHLRLRHAGQGAPGAEADRLPAGERSQLRRNDGRGLSRLRRVHPRLQRTEKRRRIDSAMDCMELRDERRSIIETLSKGFKRRVALAQAILHDPELLLLDEPTDGLDPNQKHQVRQLVKNLSESKIVVISTHILESRSCAAAPGDQRRPPAGRQHPGRTQDPQPLPPCRQPQHRSTGRPAGHRHAPRRRRYRRTPRPGRHPDHPGPPRRADPSRAQPPDPRQRLAGIRVAYRTRPTGRSVPPTDPRNPA